MRANKGEDRGVVLLMPDWIALLSYWPKKPTTILKRDGPADYSIFMIIVCWIFRMTSPRLMTPTT